MHSTCGAARRVHTPAGTQLQDGKGSSKEAVQLASAKLNTTLSILLGLCALDVHVARLVFALLGKVWHLPLCFLDALTVLHIW